MKKGFSLIEVLVFVTIFSLFFIAAISVVTVSLRQMRVNEHKILATKYAEELMEWLRAEKEIDWNNFVSQRMYSYCFNENLVSSTWPISGSCYDDYTGITGINPQIFKREVALTYDGTSVLVHITVSWQELGQTYEVPLKSSLTVWE